MPSYKIFFLDHRSCYLNSLGDSLAQLGHQIFFQSSWKLKEIEAGIAHFKPDILLTVGCDIPLRGPVPDQLPTLCRKYGLFHVYWATEDQIQHDLWSLPFINRIKPDLVWTLHPSCIPSYEARGISADHLDFKFNPRVFSAKTALDPEIYDIAFVGTTHLHIKTYRYKSFRDLLFPLVKKGVKTDIWGFGWDLDQALLKKEYGTRVPLSWYHGYLPYLKTGPVYRNARIVLGVQNADDQITQRTVEILGTGAFMIASRTSALATMLEDGKELVLSGSPEETIALVHQYLHDPVRRLQIGQNARAKILKDHTFTDHLRRVLPRLNELLMKKRRAIT
ncbi:CgeB family protein [Alteribacter lacisalsi]|uniref:CgeB family protein n=1 Tax=Alteribacter lacisalsi TaxID=2045244 RepID=UPI0013753723|nr:glycosyltransferase [Alteribacter lacisalsi]